MFPFPAAFNFQARLSSAQLGWERTRRRAALFGRAIAGVPLPGPGLDEANEKGSSKIALSDHGKDWFAFLSRRPGPCQAHHREWAACIEH